MLLRKSIFGTASMLGLAGILAFSGCSSDNNGAEGTSSDTSHGKHELGGLGLGLVLPDGSNVNNPTYTITNPSDPSFTPLTGSLSISGNVATATISGLTAESGYTVTLKATRSTPAGAPDCTGSATFTVLANQTVNVNVVLQCDDTSSDTGKVTINGSFDVCPKLGATTSTDGTVGGAPVALTAAATDKDPGDVVTIAWSTASDGSFSSSTGTSTSYTCATAGVKTITVKATDVPGCVKTFAPITINCTGTTTIDAGVPDSATPTPDAATPPVVDSSTPPAVDASTPPVDSSTPPVVDSSTPPAVDASTPDSSTPPTGARFGTPACDTCLADQCSLYQGFDAILPMCTDAACEAAFACFQRHHCAVDSVSVNQCYCGVGVSNDTCLTAGYVPVGPCAALATSTFGSSNTQVVIGQLYDEATQFGVGGTLFACAADLCTSQCVTSTSIPAP